MKGAILSVYNWFLRRFTKMEKPTRLCVNCGLPTLNGHVHCSRADICPGPSPMCYPCAEESGYTCWECELELRKVGLL